MAIAYVARAGSNSGATRGPSVTVTTTASIAAGDLIVVSVAAANVGDLNDLSSVTDSAGNTYVSAVHTVDGGQNQLTAVWYCANCKALANGSTVTVTFTSQLLASGESWIVTVDDISGAATASVTDGTNGHNSQDISSPTTWDTNSITTTNAADLVWVAMGDNQNEAAAVTNANSTPTTGWTIQTGIVAGPSNHNGLHTAYQVFAATSTYKGGGTAQAFGNGVSAVIVAFKAAAGGPTTLTRTIPTSAALLATLTRAVPATAALLASPTRTIPASVALLKTTTRTVPASGALVATLARSIPSSAGLTFTNSRAIPSSAALLATVARSVPSSAAILQPSITRAVPASAALLAAGLVRHIPSSAGLVATLARSAPASAGLRSTVTRSIVAFVALAGNRVIGSVAVSDAASASATLTDRSVIGSVAPTDSAAGSVALTDMVAEVE